jgi:hypothetical protein
MKNFFVAILTFLYVGSSAGATVYNHYCWSNLSNNGLCCHPSETCKKFTTAVQDITNNNCCETGHNFVKDPKPQHAALGIFKIKHPVAQALPFPYFEITCYNVATIVTKNTLFHLTPTNNSVAIYIRNCVFLL